MVVYIQMNKFRLHKINDGVQIILSLDCFQISIVRHKHSYGSSKGLWEIGVFWTDEPIYYNSNGDRTEFVNDVKGWLDEESVNNIVDRLTSLDQSSDRLVYNILEILR